MAKQFRILWGDGYRNCKKEIKTIDWDLLEPLRQSCYEYHDQTLEELHARGGLAPHEIWFHATGGKVTGQSVQKRLSEITDIEAEIWLENFIKQGAKHE